MFVPILLACVAAPRALAAEVDVHAWVGFKLLEPGEWDPVEEQRALGFLFEIGQDDAPVQFTFDVIRSVDDVRIGDTRFAGTTLEFDFGLRHHWRLGRWEPYLGGGLGYLDAEYEAGFESTEDGALGAWAGGGFHRRIGDTLKVGIDVRFSWAEVELEVGEGRRRGSAGGTLMGVTIGRSW